jgi:hypothetical protein
MLAIPVITLSTVAGVFGGKIWVAFACGLLLATIALSERAPSLRRAQAISTATAAVSIGESLALAQLASVGTFAIGRVVGVLLLA